MSVLSYQVFDRALSILQMYVCDCGSFHCEQEAKSCRAAIRVLEAARDVDKNLALAVMRSHVISGALYDLVSVLPEEKRP